MAAAAGAVAIGAWELAMMATATITALWAASPQGQKALQQTGEAVGEGIKEAADSISESLEKLKTKDLAPAIPKTKSQTKEPCGPGVKPECCKAAEAIKEVLDGNKDKKYKSIGERYDDLYDDKQSQPWFPPKGEKSNRGTRYGHCIQIEEQINRLEKNLKKYFDEKCTNLDFDTLEQAMDECEKDVLEEVLKRGTKPK